jgi:hypothetical protein
MQSCIDKDYDLDDVNKQAYVSPGGIVFPLDNIIEPIYLENLPQIPIPISGEVTFVNTVEGIFTEDMNEKFFFPGEDASDVEFTALVDVNIQGRAETLEIIIKPEILNEDERVDNIVLAEQRLRNQDNNSFSMKIRKEDMDKMQYASDIKFIITVKATNYLPVSGDVIKFKDLKLSKKGGFHLEL